MEAGLTFKSAREGMTAQFTDEQGRVHRNAVPVGRGGQKAAEEALRQWAREEGWNG